MNIKKSLSILSICLAISLFDNYLITSSSFAQSSDIFGSNGNIIRVQQTGGTLTLIITANGINTNDFQVVVLNNQNTGQPFTSTGTFQVPLESGSFNVRVNQISTGLDITNSGGVQTNGQCDGTVTAQMSCNILITNTGAISGWLKTPPVGPGFSSGVTGVAGNAPVLADTETSIIGGSTSRIQLGLRI